MTNKDWRRDDSPYCNINCNSTRACGLDRTKGTNTRLLLKSDLLSLFLSEIFFPPSFGRDVQQLNGSVLR